jgi:hypothetical protein
MSPKPPRVICTARRERCTAITQWIADSFTLDCALTYELEAVDRSLAERIGESLGIQPERRRLVLGDLDILFDGARRPISMEMYTNPSQWQRVDLGAASGGSEENDIEFDVAYDADGIASLDLPVTVAWDVQTRRVSIRFTGTPSLRCRIADTVSIGLCADHSLGDIQFEGVEVPFPRVSPSN